MGHPPATSIATPMPRHILLQAAGLETAPSCCIMRMASICPQCSTILPPANRTMSITPKDTLLPVGGIPMNSPLCVPLQVHRTTTLSPSAIVSSILTLRSGKALRNSEESCFTPSGPGGIPGGSSSCSTKSGARKSSTRLIFPRLKTSSIMRLNNALFCSLDIGLSPFVKGVQSSRTRRIHEEFFLWETVPGIPSLPPFLQRFTPLPPARGFHHLDGKRIARDARSAPDL